MSNEKVVVVGAGGIFRAWAPHIKSENLEVVGVVDLNIEAAQKRIDEESYNCKASTDLAETLKKTKPDFVLDLTVPEAHCSVTCTALEHGCHVIGEKPMASSMDEARRMVETADKTAKMYMVSQSRRWIEQHVAATSLMQANEVGELTTVNCDFYIGAHFGGFRAEMESPLILDMSIHHFDLMRMISGKDPLSVYAHEFNPKGSWYKGDAAASCIFEMSDGVVFTYRGSWCGEGFQTNWHGEWQFIGERGALSLWREGGALRECRPEKGEGLIHNHPSRDIETEELEGTGQFGGLKEMLRFLRTGETPQTECHDNIKSLAMVFAAMESSRKGQRVTIEI